MSEPTTAVWNSLEIVKLVMSGLTPLAVLGVGFLINRVFKRIEHLHWVNQKVIERRLNVFDQLAPILNDLLCYMTYIGTWKGLTPIEVVALKRKADKLVYVNESLFSPEFIDTYNKFIHSCFSTYTGWGNTAKIRSLVQRRQEASGKEWKDSWNKYFDTDSPANVEKVRITYKLLMNDFSSELGISLHEHHSTSGRAPANIK